VIGDEKAWLVIAAAISYETLRVAAISSCSMGRIIIFW